MPPPKFWPLGPVFVRFSRILRRFRGGDQHDEGMQKIPFSPLLLIVSALGLAPEPARAAFVEYTNLANFQSAAASVTLVNFDNLAAGANVNLTNTYASLGLTIVQRDGQPVNVVTASDGSFVQSFPASLNSGPNAISSSAVPGAFFDDSRSDNFDFIFGYAVSAAGLWLGNTGPGTNVVQFLDANNNVIVSRTFNGSESGTVGACPNCRIFYGITSTIAISRIRTIEGINDSDGIVYDDVYFTSAPSSAVPEPATLSMLTAAAAAMVFLRKRRPV
jgi:hypothetical protein